MDIAAELDSPVFGYDSGEGAPAIGAAPARIAAHPREGGLVRRAREGDPEAFRELVEFYHCTVYAFCYRWLRSAEDAQEVCQDTFVRAHRGLRSYRHGGKLSTWLYQIALNLCRDRRRSPRLSPPPCVPLENSPDLHFNGPSPDQSAASNGDLQRLAEGLEALPRRLREALVLCAVEGLSHEEASAVVGCSARAVEGRLYRARQKLARWWGEPARD